jgi:uncharacterized protein (TIGR00290 family)
MPPRLRALVSWSTGKDSAFALWRVREAGALEVVGLLTTLSPAYGRVSVHGTREALLRAQAAALGLPVHAVELPTPCTNAEYEARFGEALEAARGAGVTHVVFGDLFLADIRAYRDRLLAQHGLTGVYPLWGEDTGALARAMVASGLRARLTCVDPRVMPRELAGATFGPGFLERLPAGVDPCGENGEFHTCVTEGPMFARPLQVRGGEVVEREGFVYADVLLDEAVPSPSGRGEG